MDRAWEAAARDNPGLFDAPVVACAGLERRGTGEVVVSWSRITYRRYALRRVPGATALLPSLSVSVVQPTDDGRLLVGRMSPTTAHPGRWQFPGGSVEPPSDGRPLDATGLRDHAARELVEETGTAVERRELGQWLVSRAESGNVVVVFLASPRAASGIEERFAELVSAEPDPELTDIAFVGSAADLPRLGGTQAGYLEPIVSRYFC